MKNLPFTRMAFHPSAEGGEGDKTLVQLSQHRLNELLDRAFSKGARKAGKAAGEQGAQAPAPPHTVDPTTDENNAIPPENAADAPGKDTGDSVLAPPAPPPDNSLAAAQETLALANRRLLESMVLQEAQNLRVTGRGAAAALKLCDFTPCTENGVPSSAAVRTQLATFAGQWPEFVSCAPPAPFATGAGSDAMRQDTLKEALGVV